MQCILILLNRVLYLSQIALYRTSIKCIILLMWLTSRTVRFLSEWLGKLVRPMDLSFRLTVLSVGTLALVGISLWTAYEIEIFPRALELIDNISPKSKQEKGQHPAAPDQKQNKSAATISLYFPKGPVPVVWAKGRSDLLLRKNIALDQASETFSNACDYTEVVAIGAASKEGPDNINRELARKRAQRLAIQVLPKFVDCAQSPRRLLGVALFRPKAAHPDMMQRKATILAASHGSHFPDSMVLSENANVDSLLAVDPEDYEKVDVCEFSVVAECEWRSIR